LTINGLGEIGKIMLAHTQAIAYISTMKKNLNKHAQALGRRGGKAGCGKAKARTSEQARAAVMARWNKVKGKKS
jgi:predicted sugar kinase